MFTDNNRLRLAICLHFWLATARDSVSQDSKINILWSTESWLQKMKVLEWNGVWAPKLEGLGVSDSGRVQFFLKHSVVAYYVVFTET